MKKLSLFFISLVLCIATVLGTFLTGCDNETPKPDGGEKQSYTVTVLGEDEITGVGGVTVKWLQSGTESASAVTDADGKAQTQLAAASYDVELFNLPEGMTYTPASVTSTARGITLVLKKAEVTYSVTVKKHDNNPASGVTVTWTADGKIAGTATTAADGKASKALTYGNYSVTVSNLPLGNVYVGSMQVTGAQPDATFTLQNGQTTDYTVTVKSEGQLKFKKYTVTAYLGADAVASAETNDDGQVTFALPQGNSYSVLVQNVPDGYTYIPATLSGQNTSIDLILHSEIIGTAPAADTSYVIGDIIHEYEFTTPYEVSGEKLNYSLSDILEEKKAIILNFWGTNCSACMQEMPAMQQAYELYSDDVEFIAVSNYMGGDSDSRITSFREQNGYTFPMFRDTHSFTNKFTLTAWPTNVVIDRYGAIARIEDGALTSLSFWQKLLDQYVADDYIQTFIPGNKRADSTVTEMAKPDFKVEEGHYEKVAEAINNVSAIPEGCSVRWFGEPEATAEFTWPFILGKPENSNETVLYPSNTDHNSTFSFIYAAITMTAGKVFTFDYWAQTEADNDIFYVLFDGKVVYEISGENQGWQTCFVYTDLTDGDHQLALSYIKDESRGAGFDNVYIKNVRFTDVSNINLTTNMLRGAAYGVPASGATAYPHYAPVAVAADGYYHVKLNELQGAQYAGNDPSPMLFANLTEATNWGLSIRELVYGTDKTTGEYLVDCTFAYKGETKDWRELLKEYVTIAGNSDIDGLLPVDEDLRQLLTAFTAHVSGTSSHANEWLEVCCFYSHYGEGGPFGNPIIGLTEKTAIAVGEGRHTADLTRLTAPYPITRYSFTPDRNGVYKIESLIPESLAEIYSSQIWVYIDNIDDTLYYSGADRINRTAENEQNFVAQLYLTEGTKYYIAVAYLMNERGTLDFEISYAGESVQYLEPCSSGDYVIVGDRWELRYAVEYGKDNEGFYHVLNSDGSLGDYIYLDFKYTTNGNFYNPLSVIINQYVVDPMTYENKFKVFDFTQIIAYVTAGVDDEGMTVYNYGYINPATMDEEHAADYIDYTDIMKAYCEQAMQTDGLIKVNDELVKILTMYHYLRTDWALDGKLPEQVPHEWLRFCWYNKTVDENNPV